MYDGLLTHTAPLTPEPLRNLVRIQWAYAKQQQQQQQRRNNNNA